MRNWIFFLGVALILASCAGTKKAGKVELNPSTEAVDDSVQYELIVLDPGFESWYLTRSKPSWFHSLEYYENWNRQYVTAWNYKATTPRNNRVFDTTIDYDPFTDYGLEINHKLFYYFQYVESELGIPILQPGASPQSGL
jgi:hypothetical protein